jgi:hypothetical protein
MKKISLTLAGILCTASAAVFAQQVDTLNKQQPTQNQYRTDGTTGQHGVPNPTTPARPRANGPEEFQDQIDNSSQKQNNQPLPHTPTGSQGTVSGSTPYDTTNMSRPTVPQGTIGTNKTGTTSGTIGSGTYGTGTSGTGSGTKGTSSSYGTGNNSSTSQDSTLRKKQK